MLLSAIKVFLFIYQAEIYYYFIVIFFEIINKIFIISNKTIENSKSEKSEDINKININVDLSSLNEKEKKRLLKQQSPEFFPITQDLTGTVHWIFKGSIF